MGDSCPTSSDPRCNSEEAEVTVSVCSIMVVRVYGSPNDTPFFKYGNCKYAPARTHAHTHTHFACPLRNETTQKIDVLRVRLLFGQPADKPSSSSRIYVDVYMSIYTCILMSRDERMCYHEMAHQR